MCEKTWLYKHIDAAGSKIDEFIPEESNDEFKRSVQERTESKYYLYDIVMAAQRFVVVWKKSLKASQLGSVCAMYAS